MHVSFFSVLLSALTFTSASVAEPGGPEPDPGPASEHNASRSEIEQRDDGTYRVTESLEVYSASRRPERIIDAPVAVSVVTPEQIERDAPNGQIAKLLEAAPGVELTQSGMFDFKLNVRGLNSVGNRRLAVLIDGRDPSFPLVDVQEWAAVAMPLDDLESVELLRGPSSALYGANAFNGVLNLVTKAPRHSLGGNVRLSVGEQNTQRADLRLAVPLSDRWFFKGVASLMESDDFYRSRHETLEYSQPCTTTLATDCLPLEPAAPPLERDRVAFAGVRFDHDRDASHTVVLEGGTGYYEGAMLTGGAGRNQLLSVTRPWARLNVHAVDWNVLASFTGRDAEAVSLVSLEPLFADSTRLGLEFQRHGSFADHRGRLVGGASAVFEESSTADPTGFETLLSEAQTSEAYAVFGQLDYIVNDRLKLVLAVRWDDTDLHDPQISPQGAAVYSWHPKHSLRLSYREAFLTPSYPEYFARVPIAPAVDLSALDAVCSPHGVDCGFDQPVPVLAVGNPGLGVEKMATLEVGYSKILGSQGSLHLSIYRSEVEDFVQNGIPQIGSELGRVNLDFGPYTPPSGLPSEAADALLTGLEAALGGLFPVLSNPSSGTVLPLITFTNFGRVITQGAELGVDYAPSRRATLSFNYSWLDFEAREELIGAAPLVANGPENKFNFEWSYSTERFSASLRYRWVEGFRWVEGIINGDVPTYDVVNLTTLFRFSERYTIGLNINNLLDHEHYEFFSGDLLERHALVHFGMSW